MTAIHYFHSTLIIPPTRHCFNPGGGTNWILKPSLTTCKYNYQSKPVRGGQTALYKDSTSCTALQKKKKKSRHGISYMERQYHLQSMQSMASERSNFHSKHYQRQILNSVKCTEILNTECKNFYQAYTITWHLIPYSCYQPRSSFQQLSLP